MKASTVGSIIIFLSVSAFGAGPASAEKPGKPGKPGPLPPKAKLVLDEDWSSGKINPKRWYALRKKWGQDNFGVVPENVALVKDLVGAKRQRVLRCEAHGDQYAGPITGQWKRKKRVGGVLVSKQHFASGRFEVVMKIGSTANPRPKGIVPAIWTYGYRAVSVPAKIADHFSPTQPLYHPFLQKWGKGHAFYWSEIDFPEFGKDGKFDRPMYNTFLNSKHQPLTFDAHGAADGRYHTYTTEWRTGLVPIKGVKDSQVAKAKGFYWIQDKAVDFGRYFGNPLKRLGRDRYAVCSGLTARHWIDRRYIGENKTFVPSMSGQLNLGVWLPKWAGPAPWKTAAVYFARVRVWQYGDPGDVLGILTEDITDNFGKDGQPLRR